MNIYFNDSVGKRELVQDLILSAILPREWSLDDQVGADGVNLAGQTQTQANPNAEAIQIPEG